MPANEFTARLASSPRRHPRLVGRIEWLHRHRVAVVVAALTGILGTFMLDIVLPGVIVSGFYLIPLTLLTLTERERVVAAAAVTCLLLAAVVMVAEDAITTQHLLVLGYGVFAGVGLVALTYLVNRLTTLSRFAIARAQLAEASSDIVGMSRSRTDLDEVLQYITERAGEQLEALSGVLLRPADDEKWRGQAGYGLDLAANQVELSFAALPIASEALERDRALIIDDARRDAGMATTDVARLHFQRLLVAPMVAFGRHVGVLIFNRAAESGGFGDDHVLFAESAAQYAAVACENVRLMRELDQRRRDLELVRDSSLDIASSLDLPQVLESAVWRLVDALEMDACTISLVKPGASETQLLVNYVDGTFNTVADLDGAQSLDSGGIGQQVVQARRPLIVSDAEDARLNESERRLFVARGHRTQLVLPLQTRDRVIGLIELFDDRRKRDFSAEELQMALAICRFAAVAIDNAQLYDNERETANHLELLTRQLTELQSISLALNELVGRADPAVVLEHVAVAGACLLAAPCAAVVRRDSRGLRVVASCGNDGGVCFDSARLEEVFAPAQSLGGLPPIAGRPAIVTAGLLVAAIDAGQVGRELALVFAGARDGTFSEEDRLLATTLAAQVSATLRNTLIFRHEHEIAETFQNALRIDPWPIDGLSVGVHYDPAGEAARVGGDFYDLVQLAPGRLMVAVGDVCGKGLSAAAQTAVVRYMLRAYVAEGSPGEALSRLNSALVAQDEMQPFVTMLVAYVDVDRHMVEYAIAGHPRPIVLAGGTDFIVPGEGDMPVGIFANIVYPTNRVVLPDDSIVVLFTDGVIEARQKGRLLGEARLREIVRRHADLDAADLADVIVSEVKEYAGGRLDDDALTVLLRLP